MTARPLASGVRLPWRRIRAIALVGAALALVSLAGGWLGMRIILGTVPASARQRIETDVRASLARLMNSLQASAQPFAQAATVAAAGRGDTVALGRLFDEISSSLAQDDRDTRAITVYGAEGQPLAWAGRPSDVATDRLSGGEAWFLTQTALGLRVVYLTPVLAPDGARVGTIAAERALDTVPSADGDGRDFLQATASTPVAIEMPPDDGRVIDAGRFEVSDPSGQRLLTATVADADLERTERRWTRAALSVALFIGAITFLLLCGPVLGWTRRAGTFRTDVAGLASCGAAIVGSRVLMRLASPADYTSAEVFSGAVYASPLAAPLLTSPFDYLMSALAAVAMLLLGAGLAERARRHRVLRRVPVTPLYWACQAAAGAVVLAIFLVHRSFVADTIANTAVDLLQLSLHPWDVARLSLQVGLAVWHIAAVGLAVLVLHVARAPWRVPRRSVRTWALTLTAWLLPGLTWVAVSYDVAVSGPPLIAAVATAAVCAVLVPGTLARYRHGSQALRLALLLPVLTVPVLAAYPTVFSLVSASKRDAVETRYAPQAINQRQTIQRLMQESLLQIDRLPTLDALVTAPPVPEATDAAEQAFQIWRTTGLADYPITSSVELFGSDGRLTSRFAFNLPDDLTATLREDEEQCAWTIYEEVSPFFAEERRVLHAGRSICMDDGTGERRVRGTIVVHAILDYSNLPFIASQNPYVELLRPGGEFLEEGLAGRDLEYAVYGWSGRPLYASSGKAWDLPAATLAAVAASRAPLWTMLRGDQATFRVYLQNDRGGIYALGFPVLSPLGHLMNMAELTVLAGVVCLLLVLSMIVLDMARGRATSGRALLREIRASFYRKLFLAFVAASVLPVVMLAVLTRNYIADQLRTTVEQEAVRTVSAARRVVEDLVIPRTTGTQQVVDDNLLVWVSRLIDQDVNIFRGARLQATSERNLFASGVLAPRTPADVFRALTLNRDATAILTERVGTLSYLVAATPVTTRQFEGMLTVPLTLRQQDIEDQIDTLNRLVLLGALLFILGGAGIGYSMAERIADPVNRLTRATRRIARGDLTARIAATSSDELRRLVHDFNRMAEDLQRQRTELERTHRLEAWAEMARQVAHEIKNPLTPIQLNAEHLRRVHADRGKPLSPILDECVANILTQVSLLRTIASEFSNFASSPVVQRAPVALGNLLREILTPYERALTERVAFNVEIPPALPEVAIDRTLVLRALTNIVENALHAMPGGGTLTVTAEARAADVCLRVSDSGVGMDDQALARAFEPYFSTKVTGTGLGLPIAKRNIELSGGTVSMTSAVDRGTTVEITLPTVQVPE